MGLSLCVHCEVKSKATLSFSCPVMKFTFSCSSSPLQVALQALKERVGTRPVHCEVKSKDQYGRNVAACSIMDGRLSEDMGSWLVANGHAVAYK